MNIKILLSTVLLVMLSACAGTDGDIYISGASGGTAAGFFSVTFTR